MNAAPLLDIESEARRLLQGVSAEALPLRVLGGMAVRLRLPEALATRFARPLPDLDFVAARGEQRPVADFLEAAGYRPDVAFNALNGARRLLFFDVANGRQVDVFVGEFAMCHRIPLEERLLLEAQTIPRAELLLTKLQIVELNPKDRDDAIALLASSDVSSADGGTINGERVAELLARDWGLWRTVTLNLDRIESELPRALDDAALRRDVLARIGRLRGMVEAMPKSARWRWRARIGEHKRWYELPDEVGEAR